MTDTQAWLVNRRPTYILDTPCITKHIIVRPTMSIALEPNKSGQRVNFDPLDEMDQFKRKVLRIEVMRVLDEVLDKLCPNTGERFLKRKFIKKESGINQYALMGTKQRDSIDSYEKLFKDNSSTDKQFRELNNNIWEQVETSHYKSLYLEVREPSMGEASHLEVICDMHTEYASIQLRMFPFSKAFPGDSPSSDNQKKKDLNDLRQKLRKMYRFSEEKDSYLDKPTDVDEANDIAETVYSKSWDLLGKDPVFNIETASLQRRKYLDIYNKWIEDWDSDKIKSNTEFSPAKALSKVFLQLLIDQNNDTDPDKSNYDNCKSTDATTQATLSVAAIFEGCILRQPRLEKSEKIKEEETLFENLRDNLDHDLEKYNSRIYPDDLALLYGGSSDDAEKQKPYNRNDMTQEERYRSYASHTMRRSINHLQKNSVLFKRILGFWPEEKERKKRSLNIHGASAVLCGFLDGLAVYGCSFRQSEHFLSDESPDPKHVQVRYFLIYAGTSRNQLSRLISRLHYCGENRVMIGADFKLFKDASVRISNIGREIDHATTSESLNQQFLNEKRQNLNLIHQRIRGGIQYRVLRTHYYWNTLQSRINDMREVRIMGWQTYGEFVERIYSTQVESHLRTGDQQKEVETKIARAEEVIESKAVSRISLASLAFATLTGVGLFFQLGAVAFKFGPSYGLRTTIFTTLSWAMFIGVLLILWNQVKKIK